MALDLDPSTVSLPATFVLSVLEIPGCLAPSDVEKLPVGDHLVEFAATCPLMFGNPAETDWPTSEVVVVYSANFLCRFGRVKVVEPSPAPHFVPITLKRLA